MPVILLLSKLCPLAGALDSCPVTYELFGCIVHEGLRNSTSCGHVYSFVRTADGAWWECNDGDVSSSLLLVHARLCGTCLRCEQCASVPIAPLLHCLACAVVHADTLVQNAKFCLAASWWRHCQGTPGALHLR